MSADFSHQRVVGQRTGKCVIIEIGNLDDSDDAPSQAAVELSDLCADIVWDDETRVVVLAYDGERLRSMEANADRRGGPAPSSFVEPIARLKQPVIAAIRGDGLGLGLEMALACDIRIGTEGAVYGLPQIREGLIPSAGGTQRLPRLVGRGRALEMVLTGEPIEAEEARRIGLINRVVPPGDLTSTALELAREMASKSPLALGYVKEALHNGMDMALDQGLRMELDLYLLLFTTRDRMEGVTAFKEKRKPTFEGE